MPLQLIADPISLIGTYLRNHPDVSIIVGNRVASHIPHSFNVPWIKMTQIGADDRSARTDHLVSFLLQFDCYAGKDGGSVEAALIGRVVRAALREIEPSDVPGWTPSVVSVNGPRDLGLDTDLEPARDRTLVDCQILLHPNGPGS